MERLPNTWINKKEIDSVRYKCGYCGADTAPAYGWQSDQITDQITDLVAYIPICTNCNQPSYIKWYGTTRVSATPAPLMGESVGGLPEDVGTLYDEARKCTGVGAYTSAVLTCRKILMHVAVEKGAKKKLTFEACVDYLDENHYIPPDGKGWVDHIRTKSNEANHEIVLMDLEYACDLITLTEMLLRFMYELPGRLPKKADDKGEKKSAGEERPEIPTE